MPRYLDKQWQATLKQLAQRDAPVELSRREADSDVPPVSYRTRLFGVREDGSIIVERPGQVALDKTFGKGDDVELLLMHNNERLLATCTIKDVFIKQINKTARATSFLLSPGRRPQRDQRRSSFRVGVAAIGLPPALLCCEDEENPFEFKARIVNLSAGGLGLSIRASHKTLRQIKSLSRVTCHATLTEDATFALPMQIKHFSAIGDDGLYLGMQFDIEDPAEARVVEDRMHQLCTLFQRMSLKRKRA